jgi:hypothetical protein
MCFCSLTPDALVVKNGQILTPNRDLYEETTEMITKESSHDRFSIGGLAA